MNTSLRCRRLVLAAILALAAMPAARHADAATAPRVDAPGAIVPAQGVCRIGDFASHDRAIAVRQNLQARGYHAWIEHHGSLYSGTRTYVVFARC